MLNNEDFYALMPGAIGTLSYFISTVTATEEEQDAMMSNISSQLFSSYLSNYAFVQGDDPQTAFIKARAKGRIEAEREASRPVQRSINVQIGQKESLDVIKRIENSQGFINWSDANLVDLIKTI